VRRQITSQGGVIVLADDGSGADTGGTTNCAAAIGRCVVRVQSLDDPLVVSDTALGFDPTAVAPPPSLSVAPGGPYADGQQVVVHGAGFTPNAVLGLAQCSTAAEPGGPTCDSGPDGLFTEFRADAEGTFTRTVTLHTPVLTTDGSLDCGAAGSCELFAANRNDYATERAAISIDFAATPTGRIAPTRALASTGAGAATAPVTIAGFALLLLGSALVLLGRRRTPTA
jgi:LPXTG-motif cell wall-anchored protein